jgi:endo-1,4-beta-xylanase
MEPKVDGASGGVRRRQFLANLGARVLAGVSFIPGLDDRLFHVVGTARRFDLATAPSVTTRPLAGVAQSTGRFFGAAARIDEIDATPALRAAILADCTRLTPEIHLKWDAIEWTKGTLNFAPVDALLQFASGNGMTLRGHTLIWEQSTPAWAKRELLQDNDWQLVADHFARILGRYAGRIDEWDVVNEPIDSETRDGLRATTFYRAFGPSYIERALNEARVHAPDARLAINDYGFDYANPVDAARRVALLRVVRKLKQSGVPLDVVGIQAHLDLAKGPIDAPAVRDFIRAIADLGLDVTISELDVKEADTSAPLDVRDARVADHTQRYLDVVLSEPAVRGVITWGLSDRYSWLADGHAPSSNRGLPYDDAFVRTPMYGAIARALDASRSRGSSPA